ncbi:hypothetical protein [Clostridium grantii]|uniref:hypothetical protein n=1 Tax=Clostridium grantii TaxID=40575 RepID=UPI001356448E|nr:hypothetical protein [Clostridium grantii]
MLKQGISEAVHAAKKDKLDMCIEDLCFKKKKLFLDSKSPKYKRKRLKPWLKKLKKE